MGFFAVFGYGLTADAADPLLIPFSRPRPLRELDGVVAGGGRSDADPEYEPSAETTSLDESWSSM